MRYFKRPPFQLGIETDFDLNLDGHLLKHHFFQSKRRIDLPVDFFFPQQSVGMKSSSALRATSPYAIEVSKPSKAGVFRSHSSTLHKFSVVASHKHVS